MPRLKSWIRHIPDILQRLQTDEKPVYNCAEVAGLFIIGRSRAADLIKIAGAEVHNGVASTVSRENLILYVERCPEAGKYLAYQARREKQARELQDTCKDSIEEERFGAIIHARVHPKRDKKIKFSDLKDTTIAEGELKIRFENNEDLATKLYLLANAESNEPDEFVRLCGAKVAPKVRVH